MVSNPQSHLNLDSVPAITAARIEAIYQAVAQYTSHNDTSKPLFFDTETTGGSRQDQIIEIAICDSQRQLIINSLIYTEQPCHPYAYKVHGIHPHQLIGYPRFTDIQAAILSLLKNRTLYAYNASFDVRMMRQSAQKLRLQQVTVICLMKQFANFKGDYSFYHGSNRYHSLTNACAYFGIRHDNAHRAAADALACVDVWQGMLTSHHQDY